MQSEPKPCPFCKCKPIPFIAGSSKYSVRCSNENCGVRPSGRFIGGSNTPEEAIELWNSRPIEDALQSEIDRLKAELVAEKIEKEKIAYELIEAVGLDDSDIF